MLIENKNFPEIQTEYNYFTLRLQHRDFKLLYRIREYVIIPPHKVDNIRKNGTPLKSYGKKNKDGTVVVAYYQLYSQKLTSLKTKNKLIQRVLDEVVGDNGLTLEDHIEHTWDTKNAHKTTKSRLRDKESMILETLADYLMGGIEGDGILTRDMSRTIKNKEIVTIAGMINTDSDGNIDDSLREKSSKTWQIRKMRKRKYKKYIANTPKRWKKSNTYKMNSIYSYSSESENNKTYNWIKDTWTEKDEKYIYKIDRLIDTKKKYTSEWCLVSTENEFDFLGDRLKLDKTAKQYKASKDGSYQMDKILAIRQNGKTYFFDENIDQVENQKIKIVANRSGEKWL